jgi:hypothetical protein
MGNLAVAEELAGTGELDELFKLNATETEPEDDEEDEEEEEGDEVKPMEFPH